MCKYYPLSKSVYEHEPGEFMLVVQRIEVEKLVTVDQDTLQPQHIGSTPWLPVMTHVL